MDLWWLTLGLDRLPALLQISLSTQGQSCPSGKTFVRHLKSLNSACQIPSVILAALRAPAVYRLAKASPCQLLLPTLLSHQPTVYPPAESAYQFPLATTDAFCSQFVFLTTLLQQQVYHVSGSQARRSTYVVHMLSICRHGGRQQTNQKHCF